jgi:hypothetical protein
MNAYQSAQGQSAQMSDALSQIQNEGGSIDWQKIIDQVKAAVGQ